MVGRHSGSCIGLGRRLASGIITSFDGADGPVADVHCAGTASTEVRAEFRRDHERAREATKKCEGYRVSLLLLTTGLVSMIGPRPPILGLNLLDSSVDVTSTCMEIR